MQRIKNKSNIDLDTVRCGVYHPKNSEIYFPVPHISVLRNFKPYGKSAVNAFLYDISTFLNDHKSLLERNCSTLSSSDLYCADNYVNIENCSNYQAMDDTEDANQRYMRQRTERWEKNQRD